MDLARPHYLRTSGGGGNNRRVSSSSATNSPKFLLSPSEVGIVGTGAGVKSALLLNANAAAAEARAAEKKQRRSSLHQLLGLAVHRPGSGSASGSGQASCDEEEDGAAGGEAGQATGETQEQERHFPRPHPRKEMLRAFLSKKILYCTVVITRLYCNIRTLLNSNAAHLSEM